MIAWSRRLGRIPWRSVGPLLVVGIVRRGTDKPMYRPDGRTHLVKAAFALGLRMIKKSETRVESMTPLITLIRISLQFPTPSGWVKIHNAALVGGREVLWQMGELPLKVDDNRLRGAQCRLRLNSCRFELRSTPDRFCPDSRGGVGRRSEHRSTRFRARI